MVFGNPYSFLHVDKAEIDLPKSVDIYDDRVYEKARENLSKLVSAEVMKQDEKPAKDNASSGGDTTGGNTSGEQTGGTGSTGNGDTGDGLE